MHANFHYAIGLIIASIYDHFVSQTFWTYGCILACSFIVDFDIFWNYSAPFENHRNLLSHSIYPSIFLIFFGFIFHKGWIIMAGLSMLSHILWDMLDWGINPLYLYKDGQLFGPAILIKPQTKIEFNKMDKTRTEALYSFAQRYFHNKIIIILEIVIFIFSIILTLVFSLRYWYFILGYFFFLFFHLYEYFELKNRIEKRKKRFPIYLDKEDKKKFLKIFKFFRFSKNS